MSKLAASTKAIEAPPHGACLSDAADDVDVVEVALDADVELGACEVERRDGAPVLVDIEGTARLLYEPVYEYVIVDVDSTGLDDGLRMLEGTAMADVSLATGDARSPLMFARAKSDEYCV